MTPDTGALFEFGPFRLDVAEHLLLRDGQHVPLTPKNFAVLRILVQNGGHLVEKERLLKEVWPDSFVEEGALNRSVSVLRKTLGEGPTGQRYIETIPKHGYRFVAPVRNVPAIAEVPVVPRRRPRKTTAIVVICMAAAALAAVVVRLGHPQSQQLPSSGPSHRQLTFSGKEGFPALSPDGRLIAYVSDDKPEKKVFVQDLGGGQPREIFGAPEAGHLRWSPDGSELIVWARGSARNGIHAVQYPSGTSRLIAPDRYVACWSPDGATIAVASYLDGRLWFFDRSGVEQRSFPLHDVRWSIWDLDWSAANGLLLFVGSDYQGRYTIQTVQADGTNQQTVLSDAAEIPSVRWSADGKAIYYFRRQNQTDSLLKIALEPGAPTPHAVPTTLMSGLETDRSLAVSADGKRLVYARAPYHSNLWTLEAGGPGSSAWHTTQLTTGTSIIERPRLSPDGKVLVATIGRGALTNLYTVPIAGGAPTQLTASEGLSLSGVWSPDGRHIAFASLQDGKPRVWMVPADGGIPQPLSSGAMSDSFDLAWSPSGRILYQQAGNQNYYELNPDTREERLLIRGTPPGWMFSPVYSPDGRRVAVQWNRPNRGIWVIDMETGRQTLVCGTPASVMPIGWSADATAIYAIEAKPSRYRGVLLPLGETSTEASIVRVTLDTGRVETVAAVPFEEIGTVAMTRDAGRFIVSVYSSRSDVWVVDDFDTAPRLASRVPAP